MQMWRFCGSYVTSTLPDEMGKVMCLLTFSTGREVRSPMRQPDCYFGHVGGPAVPVK